MTAQAVSGRVAIEVGIRILGYAFGELIAAAGGDEGRSRDWISVDGELNGSTRRDTQAASCHVGVQRKRLPILNLVGLLGSSSSRCRRFGHREARCPGAGGKAGIAWIGRGNRIRSR